MENVISEQLDMISGKEKELRNEISEREDDAKRALTDLYESIEKLCILRKGTTEGMVDISDFIETVRGKYVGVRIENFEQRQDEIVNLIDNISWSVRTLIDKINKFEQDVNRNGD